MNTLMQKFKARAEQMAKDFDKLEDAPVNVNRDYRVVKDNLEKALKESTDSDEPEDNESKPTDLTLNNFSSLVRGKSRANNGSDLLPDDQVINRDIPMDVDSETKLDKDFKKVDYYAENTVTVVVKKGAHTGTVNMKELLTAISDDAYVELIGLESDKVTTILNFLVLGYDVVLEVPKDYIGIGKFAISGVTMVEIDAT